LRKATWQNTGVDWMACLWLINRRIEKEAEFTFIQACTQSLPENTDHFDIPGTHHRGHYSYLTCIKEFRLKDPILKQTAFL
jgi:hypothetical protein